MQAELVQLELVLQLHRALSSVGRFPQPLLTPSPLSRRRNYAYGLCAFAARPIHREVVGFVAFAHRSKASAKEQSPSGLAAKADFARRRALREPGASRYIPEAPWNDEVAAAQRGLEQVVLQCG